MTLADAERQVYAGASYEDVVRVLNCITEWPKEAKRYGQPCSAFSIGAGDDRVDYACPKLSKMIIDFCKETMRKSTTMVTFNCVRVDCNNSNRRLVRQKMGRCAFFGLGAYTGGELQVETEFLVTIKRMIVYDAGIPHAHKYFRGKRLGITCFLSDDPDAEVNFAEIPLYKQISCTMCISVLSRDLGCFNTYINTDRDRLELSYKRQGIWALKVEKDFQISERHLYDTYFTNEPFESKDWDTTIYTVSDTACAASRPLSSSLYNHFYETHGLYIPRIDYRTPFVIVVSKIWGNGVMLGSRCMPFSATLYFSGGLLQLACSSAMYNSGQAICFD